MAEPDVKRWADTWRAAGRELDARRRLELRTLSDDDVRRAVADLFSLPPPPGLPPRASSGLVEQQRFFARLHRGR